MIRRALRQLAKWLLKATEPGTLDTTRMGCRIWQFDDAGVSTWGAPVSEEQIQQITRHVLEHGHAVPEVLQQPYAGVMIPYNPRHGTPVAAVIEAAAELETLPMRRDPKTVRLGLPSAERKPAELAGTADTDVRPPDLAGAIAARTEPEWSHPGQWPRTTEAVEAVIAEVREKTGPGKGKKFCHNCGTRTGASSRECPNCGYGFKFKPPRPRKGITVGSADVE